MGGRESNVELDLRNVEQAQGDGGVPHGQLLLNFVDVTMSLDPAATAEARAALVAAIGPQGVVDAAAVAAMFQLNTRAADAAGIPVEQASLAGRSSLGARLGFAPRLDGLAP